MCVMRKPDVVQRAHRGLPSGAGTAHLHFEALHADLRRRVPRLLGGDLRREGRALARSTEAAAAGGRPAQRVALPIRDRDDRVVEGSVDVRDRVRDVLLDLLLRCCRSCHLALSRFPRRRACATPSAHFLIARRGPLRVRAFVRVRCPRSGSPRR